MAVPDEIRILIADDHPVVRKGLRMTIEEDAGLKVIAEAGDGETALQLIRELVPHVAVLDIDMPKMDGFAVAREAVKLAPGTKIIFLTLHTDENLFRAAMRLGAKGYILKDSAMQEIAVGVRTVAAGGPYYSSAMTARFMQEPKTADATSAGVSANLFTTTERHVMQLIGDGKSSKEIGAALNISYRTVENHRSNICRKLGLEGANALVRFALQNKPLFQ